MDKDSGPPRLGVNLLYIVPGLPGGTVTYARELLQSLAKSGNWRIMLYVQRGAFQLASEYPNVRYRQFGPFKSLLTRVLSSSCCCRFWLCEMASRFCFLPVLSVPCSGCFARLLPFTTCTT